jgi:multidrug efflux pump subunit AcrB
MMKSVDGAIYVNNDVGLLKSDLRLNINTEKSRSLGILTSDIDKTVRLAISGVELGQYTNEQGDDYNIVVNSPKDKFATLKTFDDIYVNNAVGTPIPLKQVADIQILWQRPQR